MVRGVLIGAGCAAIVAAALTGCSKSTTSSEKTVPVSSSAPSSPVTASSGSVTASAGTGTATVSIDGKAQDINGQIACTTVGGRLSIAIGERATGVAVMMAPDASTVTSVGLGNVDGVALGYQEGAPGGSASATRDGQTYTITGTATGVDMANPMQPLTKPFEIKVSCP